MSKLVVVRIRGDINLDDGIRKTFTMLRLLRKHACVILEDTPAIRGMILKVQHYVTWGEVSEEVVKELVEKRGQKTTDKEGKEVAKQFFNLHPPRGGFERKGIKQPYTKGGVLGYRGTDINKLIQRMI
jgi:large subunit ribosomal protein L30